MTKIKKVAVLLMALVLTIGLAGCTTYDNFYHAFFEEESDETQVIKIGIFEPITGLDAADAADEIKGMELAHEMFGEVNGAKIELVYGDNQSDITMARTVAQQLVDQGVNLVLGSYRSTLSLAGSDAFEAASIPTIAATCTNPLVTQTNEFYFRVCFVDAYQGMFAAKYITDALHKDSAVCLKKENDDYGAAMIEQFQKQMEKTCGPGSVAVIEYPDGTEDFEPYIKSILSLGRGCVFFPSSSVEGDKVIRAAQGSNLSWIGSSRWEDILEVNQDPAVDNLEYLRGVTYVKDFDADFNNTEMKDRFIKAYQEKYGEGETPSQNCALGFDAYLLAIEGLKASEGSLDGVIITSKIKNIRGLECATGTISIGSKGDPTKDVQIEAITGAGPVAVFTASPD